MVWPKKQQNMKRMVQMDSTFSSVIHTASQQHKNIRVQPYLRICIHSSLCFARWQAAQHCQLLQCDVSQGPHLPVQCTAVNITSSYLEKLQKMSFGLQTCVKCNKRAVHCNSNFYNPIKPKKKRLASGVMNIVPIFQKQ